MRPRFPTIHLWAVGAFLCLMAFTLIYSIATGDLLRAVPGESELSGSCGTALSCG